MNDIRERHELAREIGFSLLAEGKILKVRAEGYSMYPAIKPGSVICIEPPGKGYTPAKGEIIAWRRQSGFVVHRVVRILKTGDGIKIITRGDSGRYEDQPVGSDVLAGRVVRIESPSGRIIQSREELIRKPLYIYNRLMVWFLLRMKRVKDLITN